MIVEDITERKRIDHILKSIVESTAATTGEDFFKSLVKQLATLLDVCYAFVGKMVQTEAERIKTIAVWADGGYADNIEYDLAGTPCANVVEPKFRFYPKNVRQQFPEDRLLVEMEVESYMGTPLIDSSGETIGVLVIMDRKPMEDLSFLETIMAIIATRTIAEIERERILRKLEMSRKELRNLFINVHAIREEERTSIAREIHDELGQLLTAIKIDISSYKELFHDNKPLIEKTNNILEHINMSIQTVKKITSDLRPGVLDRLGILPAIQWYAKEFQKRTKIKCVLTFSSEDIMLDNDLSTAIFRVFQESLTNVARHANASSVKADLTKDDDRLKLEIIDDGKGITESEISSADSYGLIGIRERVRFLKGKIKIKGEKGKGTTITITIPLLNKEESDDKNTYS
jgi:signal transduction histidine kinase